MTEFNTYFQGFNDGESDLNEGWIPGDFDIEKVTYQLKVMIDPSDDYIEGYIAAVFG